MTSSEKFTSMLEAIGLFVAIVGLIVLVASRFGGRRGDRVVAGVFLLPTVVLVLVGLVYPALRTIYYSFYDAAGSNYAGLDNYKTIFTSSDQITVLRNTVLWVVITPFVATAIGLLYAILVDKARVEALAKAFIFLPMAISFVGASIIWKFIYEYRPDQPGVKQIGLLNQVLVWLGGSPHQWLINSPWNSLFLVVVMIWIQAGFAMTVLSAAIKAIPEDIVEAARLDGVKAWGMFRFVTVPSIRPAMIVVLTTIGIGTLKVFDIVRTMTGGQFDTSVVANEFYAQSFRSNNQGLGAALAVLLFLLVVPIVLYNVRQLRRSETR
ncbi:MAG: alpha-glucoside transport system permease protein [Frankiales bacterium]|nr:alpha-glucoside transport system permease protein [Frankiales bacterium]MDX6273386.1 alpha-glucoside transport system permease protein [Frankiales bacterium]